MSKNSVDTLREEIYSVQKILEDKQEISLLNDYNKTMAKVFLLSCASFFENEVKKMLEEYANNSTDDEKIVHLIKNQILNRNYHTLFQWQGNNVNQFAGFFGTNFKTKVEIETKKIRDFKII